MTKLNNIETIETKIKLKWNNIVLVIGVEKGSLIVFGKGMKTSFKRWEYPM